MLRGVEAAPNCGEEVRLLLGEMLPPGDGGSFHYRRAKVGSFHYLPCEAGSFLYRPRDGGSSTTKAGASLPTPQMPRLADHGISASPRGKTKRVARRGVRRHQSLPGRLTRSARAIGAQEVLDLLWSVAVGVGEHRGGDGLQQGAGAGGVAADDG